MLDEHNCLILTSLHVPKLKNITPMLENNNLSYTSENHSSVTVLKHFVHRWQMNITTEFQLPILIPSWDIENHDFNIETSLTVSKIIQAWQYY